MRHVTTTSSPTLLRLAAEEIADRINIVRHRLDLTHDEETAFELVRQRCLAVIGGDS